MISDYELNMNKYAETACILYMKNDIRINRLKDIIILIQSELDKNTEYNIKYIIKDNTYLFDKLLFNEDLYRKIADFFIEKYLILFKEVVNLKNIKFIKQIEHKQVEIDDFEYYFFIHITNMFNEFILKNNKKISKEYNNKTMHDDKIFYIILEKLYYKLKVDCDNQEYYDNYKNINPDFICPISLEIMDEPVKTIHGQIFDRSSIEEWLANKNECPITRKYMTKNDFSIDTKLKYEVEEWKEKNLKIVNHYKCRFICCDEIDNEDYFKEYYYLNCYDENGFNFKLECPKCNKKIFKCIK